MAQKEEMRKRALPRKIIVTEIQKLAVGSAPYTYSKGELYQHERDGHIDAKRGGSLDATTKRHLVKVPMLITRILSLVIRLSKLIQLVDLSPLQKRTKFTTQCQFSTLGSR